MWNFWCLRYKYIYIFIYKYVCIHIHMCVLIIHYSLDFKALMQCTYVHTHMNPKEFFVYVRMCMYNKMYVYVCVKYNLCVFACVYVESSIKSIFSFSTGHDKMCIVNYIWTIVHVHVYNIHTYRRFFYSWDVMYFYKFHKNAFRENICNHEKLFLYCYIHVLKMLFFLKSDKVSSAPFS